MIESIWVEQSHIDEGVPRNLSDCAIARAFYEATGLPTVAHPNIIRIFYAKELMDHYLAGNEDMREYWLKDSCAYRVSPAVGSWIKSFDRNKLSVPPLYLWYDYRTGTLQTDFIPPAMRRFENEKGMLKGTEITKSVKAGTNAELT